MASKTLFCSRGAYYRSSYSPISQSGMFQLFPPLVSPVTPVIFTSSTVVRRDIASPIAYLDNEKLFYSYGQAWGEVNITGEVLLGNSEFGEEGVGNSIINSAANGLRLVELYFDLFRASTYGQPIILSALRYAKPVKFYLTSYTRGAVNPEYNTVAFSLQGAAIEKSNNSLGGVLAGSFLG